MNLVSQAAEADHTATMDRRFVIERRKEGLERLQLEKQKVEKEAQEAADKLRKEQEAQRLEQEAKDRQLALAKKKSDAMELERIHQALASHGKTVDKSELAEMDKESRTKKLVEVQSEVQKAKDEESKRLADQAKRLDYITRALRIESGAMLEKKYVELMQQDRQKYEKNLADQQVKFKAEHAEALQKKARLLKMQSHREPFQNDLVKSQKALFDANIERLRVSKLKEYRERKVARAKQLLADEQERAEEEAELERDRIAKEESERELSRRYEDLRKQREKEDAEEREREAKLAIIREQAKKDQKEKAEAAQRESAAREAEIQAKKLPMPSIRSEPPVVEGDWKRAGPSGSRQPPPAAATSAASLPISRRDPFDGRRDGVDDRSGKGERGDGWSRGSGLVPRGADRAPSDRSERQPPRDLDEVGWRRGPPSSDKLTPSRTGAADDWARSKGESGGRDRDRDAPRGERRPANEKFPRGSGTSGPGAEDSWRKK